MIPVIRGVVRSQDDPDSILLQRRDFPVEPVYRLLELPGGRWRSGESPADALVREVREETSVRVHSVQGVSLDRIDAERLIASIRPLLVVAGVNGGFPVVHTVLVAEGSGDPTGVPGETADVRWWRMEEVLHEMAVDRDGFVPSSFAALAAYAEWLGSTGRR